MPTVSIYNQPLTPSPDIWNVAPPRDPLSASLVSYWELDEASGTRIDSNDLNKNHLTDNNTVTQNTGKVGSAAEFTLLNSEYLTRASNASLQTGDIDQTICAWVYLNSKPAGTMRIAGKTDNTTGAGYAIDWQNAADRFSFRMWQAGGGASLNAIASHFGAPALSTWYFVVARFDSVSGNGIITVNDGTKSATAKSASPGSDTVAFAIGANGDGTAFFDGRIDQVGLWKRYLTDTEVTFLYNNGAGRTYAEVNGALLQTASIVSISAPDVPGVDLTMPQTVNTVTVTAPAQSHLVDSPLSAGANTITVTAPTVPSLALTMPQTANIVSISAPDVPGVALTMPQTANVVAVTAPTVPSLALTMPQTANIVTISAPTAVGVFAAPSLEAGANTITVTAPTVPSLALTMPQTANTITVTAPAQTQTSPVTLGAGFALVKDDFTGADGTALAAHTPNWTVVSGNFDLSTNRLNHSNVTASADSWAYWSGRTWANDHTARARVGALGSNRFIGITVRTGAAGKNYYAVNWSDASNFFYSYVGGISNTFSSGGAFAENDVIELVARGTNISVWKNGALLYSVTDANLATGSPGVTGWNLTGSFLDNFEAEELENQLVTVSAPAQSQLVAVTLAAGANTVTVTAPAQSQLVAITLAAGANTVTVTAPAQTELHAVTLIASGVGEGTESFTDTDGVALATHSGAWTVQNGNFDIKSNALTVNNGAAAFNYAHRNDFTPTDIQYAKARIVAVSGESYIGVSVRAAVAAQTSYNYYSNNGTRYFFKTVAEAITIFGSSGPFAANDVIELRAIGDQITPYLNGVIDSAVGGTVTDASITSGRVGVAAFQSTVGTATQLDDWEGGSYRPPLTVTVTAPAQSQLVAITLAAGANTVTVTAPVATLVIAGVDLTAGVNTVTISAPTVPSLALTMPQTANTVTVTAPGATGVFDGGPLAAGANTITVTAPAQSQLATVTLAAGANTVTVSAPAQSQLVANTLAAGQNAITVTAPLVPSVHLTMPIGTNTITVSAPAQSQIVETFLAAGANTITVSAPTQSQLVAITLAGGQNTVAVSAPTSLLLVAQAAAAGQNTVLVTAPDAGILVTFDVVLELGPNVVTILAPTITFQPQYFGNTVKEYMVYVPIEAPRTVKIYGAGAVGHEARIPLIVQDTAKRVAQ